MSKFIRNTLKKFYKSHRIGTSVGKTLLWIWIRRDLPKIIDNGLWYPLLYYKVSPEWWNTKFASWKSGHTESWDKINPPVVCEDGLIWALKMGTNRLQALKFMGFDTVDAVCFSNSNELVKVGLMLRDKDPYNV